MFSLNVFLEVNLACWLATNKPATFLRNIYISFFRSIINASCIDARRNDIIRMWMVKPKYLCRQHLLGEHKELHMLAGCLQKGKNIRGYLDDELLFPQLMYQRHDALVAEMFRRCYKHESPLPLVETLPYVELTRDRIKRNEIDLCERCEECFVRIVSGVVD